MRHTLLHAATLREAWPRWLAAADVPDLKPARDQVFEHFYFAIQAAIEGLGVVMGPLALVSDELREGRLLGANQRTGAQDTRLLRLCADDDIARFPRLRLSGNGWLPPVAWRRLNIPPISPQIGPNIDYA